METKEQYGVIEAKKEFPPISLLRVPHRSKGLVLAYPAFGSNSFNENIKKMQKSYSHPETGEKISFREPSTSESISAAAYNFKDVKKSILDPKWLQLGRIVRTSEGVFANPPKDKDENPIIDEKYLKSCLNNSKKVNGIYLSDNDFGFAPYETFKRGVQEAEEFAESGLARLLEHTEEKIAKNLRKIASPEFYKKGVNVLGFDKVKEPVLKIAGMDSYGVFGGGLGVDGGWGDSDGCVFGVLKKLIKL